MKATVLGSFASKGLEPIPFLSSHVPAGFPSPADDYVDQKLDLNELIIKHPAATFFVRAHGSSMENAGIRTNDLLVVDRAVQVTDKCIVIAVVNGEFTVKRLSKVQEALYLMPENPDFEPTPLTQDTDVIIWGVVTHVIHAAK